MTTGRQDSLQEMGIRRVSAIIRSWDEGIARSAMDAAVRGGFRMVEFTLTTPGALGLIREFAARPGLLVGAGTVLSVEDAEAATAAGARFLVSPVFDAAVVAAAARLDVVSVPGTATPTEMLAAHRAGADVMKVFPAPADVAAFVRQVRGPLPWLRLFPTAGVAPENFLPVLRAGAFGVGFVGTLFPAPELEAGEFVAIEERAREIHRLLDTLEAGR